MRIDPLKLGGSQLQLRGAPTIGGPVSPVGQNAAKSIGEAPPIILDLKDIGKLAALFLPSGLVGRLRKRLNHLKNKKCTIVPAKGTVACVDEDDVVYLGVEFLEKFQNEEETLAGVLAHEWGHACALKPDQEQLQDMSWDEIFEVRRAHETLADETSGRLLFMMGYKTDGLIRFLNQGKDTHNLKYHSPQVRSQIIQYGFEAEKKKAELSRSLFSNSGYKNPYSGILLDIA